MAANTDLFKKLSRRWVGQIGAGGVSDGVTTTIPLASTTNLPTGTAVVVVIDRVDSTGSSGASQAALEETVIGVVSGSNLANCIRGAEGTAQAHNAGAVVEVLFTAQGWNDLVDGLLVQHNQLGLHTNVTASNITASATLTGSHVSASDITARQIQGVASTNLDLKMSSAYFRRPTIVELPIGSAGASLATGDGQAFFRVPDEMNGMNLTGVAARVYTAGTTGTMDIQIRNHTDTADMLSTKITIDSTEVDTSTAATPAVINTSTDDVATGDMIAVDIDAVQTTPAKGLIVQLRFELP